ncbi:hypothetical protein AYO21_03283 [Fonsecaea monophora]|uniref:Alpha/beta hydrolase fold-3 domain-containing protein n=1 Tax=Fonsecaea monophora TaxID=254056 RepID=A0A177FDV3_9EURO|nr:hypothetical protein AYO21_03283 [Fonsecaea monophora]KAH0843002.1 alpha beta hydrolase fold-3 domain protein [Fonsecaea pedrosoi]OAG42407.1 hypothetical protein AYO21_03283 [Fonsecaea monophora]
MASNKPLSVDEQRQAMAEAEAAGLEYIGPCPSHLREAWIDIPVAGTQANRTKVVWPNPPAKSPIQCPLIVFFHGGGLSACSPDLVLAPARGFAELFNCVVACPTLNQLPEQPFPAPVQMAWDVCVWLSDGNNLNTGVLKDAGAQVDLGRGFVVGGLSSGGAVAAVIGSIPGAARAGVKDFVGLTSLRSPITGIFSGLPFLITETIVPLQYRDLFRSRDDDFEYKVANEALRLDLESRLTLDSPWFSPVNLDLTDPQIIQDHPPKVFVYGGQFDQFRDDAVIYAKWLSESVGVQVKSTVLEGEGHTAWVSPPWPASHTRKIKEVTLDGMAWLLNVEFDKNQENLPI